MCLLLLGNCGGANPTSMSDQSADRLDPNVVIPTDSEVSPQSWENLLRKLSGVEVNGNYPNLSLKVRGSQSFYLSTEPLFVLEGVPLGNDFRSLDGAATPSDVKYIQVIKGSDASMYGVRGANGVIVVTLK